MNKGYTLLAAGRPNGMRERRAYASARPALAPKCNLYSFAGP
jgi:hypothetical protein